MHEGGFSEVYDWRPSVEKTDVMRTMEAIEGEYFCELCRKLSRCVMLSRIKSTIILLFFLLINMHFIKRILSLLSEAQPLSSQDKSPWRKSSLNVPNSMEETDPRYSRRFRSRHNTENALVPSTLQVSINIIL